MNKLVDSQAEKRAIMQLLAELCGVGNVVRKTNIKGRERVCTKIYESHQDSDIKNILQFFVRAYMDGQSKEVVRTKLVMRMHVSELVADEICNLSCLVEWNE